MTGDDRYEVGHSTPRSPFLADQEQGVGPSGPPPDPIVPEQWGEEESPFDETESEQEAIDEWEAAEPELEHHEAVPGASAGYEAPDEELDPFGGAFELEDEAADTFEEWETWEAEAPASAPAAGTPPLAVRILWPAL